MTREIKFRAWNVEEKKMTKKAFGLCDISGYNGDYTFSNASIGEVDIDDLCNKKWIIMQYTGLKDKNGKEIYEGDVILYNDVLYPNKKVTFDYTIKGVGIGWYPFCVAINSLKYLAYSDKAEVVGNVYENPELIK